jgi:hypothetical protein
VAHCRAPRRRWTLHRTAPGVRGLGLEIVGAAGLAYTLGQGFAIGPSGWSFDSLASALPPLGTGQHGMGLGAALVIASFAMLFALGSRAAALQG